MVYGTQITIVTGANLNQHSHHWGASHCSQDSYTVLPHLYVDEPQRSGGHWCKPGETLPRAHPSKTDVTKSRKSVYIPLGNRVNIHTLLLKIPIYRWFRLICLLKMVMFHSETLPFGYSHWKFDPGFGSAAHHISPTEPGQPDQLSQCLDFAQWAKHQEIRGKELTKLFMSCLADSWWF